MAALVLAGGAARRMGGVDKPLLEVGGRTILQSVIEALGDLPKAISANGDPNRFASFGLPVLPDSEFKGEGPLAGILAGLDWAGTLGMQALLTVPGDMPFLPSGLAEVLWPAPKAARANGRSHHLVATWPIACKQKLRAFLTRRKTRRVSDFAASINMIYLDFGVESRDFFANINTPEDLAHARSATSSGQSNKYRGK